MNTSSFPLRRLLSSTSSNITSGILDATPRSDHFLSFLLRHGSYELETGSTQYSRFNINQVNAPPKLIKMSEIPSSILSSSPHNSLKDLHPLVRPICYDEANDLYLCALESPSTFSASFRSQSSPKLAPLVITRPGSFGVDLVSLNSEHFLKRIAVTADFLYCSNGDVTDVDAKNNYNNGMDIIQSFNKGLGQTPSLYPNLPPALDKSYVPGGVTKLNKGLDKFLLLIIAPFPDLYRKLALTNAAQGLELNALLSSESSNGKFPSFASSLSFYSKILGQFPKTRTHECKDAARSTMKSVGLWSVGVERTELAGVGRRAGLLMPGEEELNGDDEIAIKRLGEFYERVKESEKEAYKKEEQNMTQRDILLEEAAVLMDRCFLDGRRWGTIRGELAAIYDKCGLGELAKFVDK